MFHARQVTMGDIMTDGKYRQVEKKLRKAIKDPPLIECPEAVRERIEQAIQKSIVLPLRSKRKPKSSGSFPAPESPPVWAIGMFGSVWCDIDVAGTTFRVAFYNQGMVAESLSA